METYFRQCNMDDIFILRDMAYKTYDDSFRHMNSPENMEDYLESAFRLEQVKRELQNPNSFFYFLYVDGELAGYLKINDSKAQTDINDPKSLEMQRMYIIKDNQSRGLGSIMLEKAMEIADEMGKEYVWLSVWEENASAISFYEKHGFMKAGCHSFMMGADEQIDYVMRKDLT